MIWKGEISSRIGREVHLPAHWGTLRRSNDTFTARRGMNGYCITAAETFVTNWRRQSSTRNWNWLRTVFPRVVGHRLDFVATSFGMIERQFENWPKGRSCDKCGTMWSAFLAPRSDHLDPPHLRDALHNAGLKGCDDFDRQRIPSPVDGRSTACNARRPAIDGE